MTEMAAYEEAAVDLGKSIALGAVPMLGQAIDLYDTLESALALYRAQDDEDKENAKFDLLLAIIGWVPGPGDGVKKSLRIVNKDPQRFAPVLFDLLRRVLHLAGIETSPEALLQGIFDSAYLRAQMGTIQQSVQDYSGFKALPEAVQKAVMNVLAAAALSIPMMVAIVEKRLLTWKRMQRNSSAREPSQGRAHQNKPDKRDAEVHKTGKDGASHGHAGESVKAAVAEKALHELTNEIVGISGEHIADYMCAYTFKWGNDWKQHDDGAQGRWTEGTPDKNKLGKLSKGGSPKTGGTLYRLDDGPNGTGIDAVWRANGNNGGKPYAIVEAKATKDEDAPKFAKLPGNKRQPSIRSKLADNAPDLNPQAKDLIEPNDDDGKGKAVASQGAKSAKSAGLRRKLGAGAPSGKSNTRPTNSANAKAPKEILVQMSHEWIEANIERAVEDPKVRKDFKRLLDRAYSRHLFYAPYWHPSGSPKAHMIARHEGKPPSEHATHYAYHYDDAKVKAAVNYRKTKLRAKPEFAKAASLKEEK